MRVGFTAVDFLFRGTKDQRMEFMFQTQDPQTQMEWYDGRGPFRHDGEECVLVLNGTIEVTLGNEVIQLREGDCVYFPGQIPHSWRNPSDEPARLLIAESPPIEVRPDYYDHLTPEEREYAFKRMREFGLTPPAQ